METRKYFKSINIEELRGAVKNEREEDVYLKFKIVNHPINSEYDKKNLSKCTSGFSNSNGGIIVWGVKASINDKIKNSKSKLVEIFNQQK